MINKIIFYNHAHNGDIFISKTYVSYIMKQFPEIDFLYAHEKDNKIIKDLNISYENINRYGNRFNKYYIDNNTLHINTWIGNYMYYGDCNWITLHLMFKEIITIINEHMGSNIEVLPIKQYCPQIDFSHYDIPKNFEVDYNNTIIISNGPVLSGQSEIISLDPLIESILNNFDNKKIILTHNSSIIDDRILYCSDIINTNGPDLNEISWLSTKCKYLIGRQSGPFIYMQIPQNINDKNKVMISIGIHETTDWLYEIKTNANYTMLLEKECDYIEETLSILRKHVNNDSC